MDNKAKLIKPDGTEEEIVPKNGTDFNLHEINKIIGCSTFELLQGTEDGKRMFLLVDEDGIANNLPKNENASLIWAKWNKPCPCTYLLGNAILCPEEMVK